ncbi:1-deoxy-D-xylulose-5-phosphate synthase N-terminal domain-containing protein, partial [Campylobacter coli]
MNEIIKKDYQFAYTKEELEKLNLTQLEDLAARIREKIIDVVSKNGGHLSSNLG